MRDRARARKAGVFLSFILFASMFLSVFIIPLPIAEAAPTYSWSTFTVAASGDDVEILSATGFSNYTTDGDNLWVRSDNYTTRAWLRFEGLSAITDSGGIIDQIILSMYSGVDEGADFDESPYAGGMVSVSCPTYTWDWELSEANIALYSMTPIASFDGDNLSPSGAWYNKTISNSDPRDWYAWTSTFNDVFTCYVGSLTDDVPDYTYYRSFTSFDEGNPAKLYVKYHTGEGYEEVLSDFDVYSATYVKGWNNYNIWNITNAAIGYTDMTQTGSLSKLHVFDDNRFNWTEINKSTNSVALGYYSNLTGVDYFNSANFYFNFTVTVGSHNAAQQDCGAIYLMSRYGIDEVNDLVIDYPTNLLIYMDLYTVDVAHYRFLPRQYTPGGSTFGNYSGNLNENTWYMGKIILDGTKWRFEIRNTAGTIVTACEHTLTADQNVYAIIPFASKGITAGSVASGEMKQDTPDTGTYVVTDPSGNVITEEALDTYAEALAAAKAWDVLYGPVVAISIANIEAVEWVFEGNTRYEFTVVYINVNLTDIGQVGVGFTDETNDFHSVWYDRDANTLTVTSPEDGISGWLHSISQTGINVTAVFHIMFNSPIPDSYDVSAYARIVDTVDSGWVTPRWGEDGLSGSLYLFNIYNLGGLSTLTSSGTAGRVTGGDIFELYAADTRTNIAGTEYFDVRDEPLSWYNVLTNEDLLINEMPPDWEFNLPRRTQSITIRLTNNLPEDRTSPETRTYVTPGTDDVAYVSYPFSMRLLSDPFLSGNYQIGAELTFPRVLTSADGILCVQAYMMNPNTTTTTGAFRVRDGSRLEAETKILSDVQFNGNGSWASYNSTASEWLYYESYAAYTWYNVTVALNLTAAVYDIFIDDVEVVSDLPYRNPAATTAHVVAFSQYVPAAGAPDEAFLDFYVDNVRQWTDFDADYGGYAEATMLFKQLQHWSMDFDFFVENGKEYAQGPTATPSLDSDDYSDHGYIELGWDVMLNETWVNDYLVARVNITDGQISGKNDWVKFNVTWLNQGVYVKNDMLYGLFEGYSLFPGSSRDTTGFHWDIWFNRANASTVIGARINTEFFGMSDKSVWWAVWSSKWQPMRTEVSDSTIFIDLEDADSAIQSAKDVLFVRSWVKVLRTSESTFAYKVLNIGGLDFMVAIDTMSGIDTPPVRETKVPDVLSGFLGSSLGSIFSAALKRLGNTLAGFGMGFFTMSIDFIDNVFAALGYPALVSTIFGWMDTLFSFVPTLLGYGMTLIGSIYTLINTSATDTLTQLTGIITIWAGMYGTMQDFLTGVMTPGLNLWEDLGVNSFIQIGAILYPVWLLMMLSDKGGQAVMDHLNGVLNIGSFFLNFILNVGGFFMSLLTGLIGAIRG